VRAHAFYIWYEDFVFEYTIIIFSTQVETNHPFTRIASVTPA